MVSFGNAYSVDLPKTPCMVRTDRGRISIDIDARRSRSRRRETRTLLVDDACRSLPIEHRHIPSPSPLENQCDYHQSRVVNATTPAEQALTGKIDATSTTLPFSANSLSLSPRNDSNDALLQCDSYSSHHGHIHLWFIQHS